MCVQVDSPKFTDPHTKVNALLQSHFSRTNITGNHSFVYLCLFIAVRAVKIVCREQRHMHRIHSHTHTHTSTGDLSQDQRSIVPESVRLLQAVVDVVASSGWLSPALVAMEMSQMVVQVCVLCVCVCVCLSLFPVHVCVCVFDQCLMWCHHQALSAAASLHEGAFC